MQTFLYILAGIGGVLLVLIAVVLCRTFSFRPKKEETVALCDVTFDQDAAVKRLQTLVRFPTVSYHDKSKENDEAFEGLVNALPTLYPHVFRTCTLTRTAGRGLLFCWKGKAEGDATVLMAHYDVVPVSEADWEKPPFDAVLENGVLWGRGTLDTKVTVNAILSAADTLIGQGFVPSHDVYFAFSGGEEVNGEGACRIVDELKKQGVTPALVLDEGGAVVENVFPGVKQACGMIGIAEKGMINLRYEAKSQGGHASAPKPHTPVGILAAACKRVEDHPFPCRLTDPVYHMFQTLGRYSTFVYRMIFANLWLFFPLLSAICKKSGGELNALLRTTVAFTQMEGSDTPNVIPPHAAMVSNIRLNPRDSVEGAVRYLKKTVGDEDVTLTVEYSAEPSPVSVIDAEGYRRVANAVSATWQGAITTPYLMMQCSDSRHYGGYSDKVYRFSAMDLTKEERATIHGHNERIRLETIYRSVEFYLRLMQNS